MTQQNISDIYERLDGQNIVAVASGKGGVGKTFLSVTLAHVFAASGEKVLLVDGDLGLPNIDIQLGLNTSCDLRQVLTGKIPMNQAVTHVPAIECDVLAGHSGLIATTSLGDGQLQLLRDDLRILAQHYDRVFWDLGTGIEKTITLLGSSAGTVLIVCTEDPTSLADAYTLVKYLSAQSKPPRFRIVVNMANTQKEGERTYQTLLKACQNFLNAELELGGIIHQESHIKECVRQQVPFLTTYPDSPAVQDIEALVSYLKNR